MWLQKKITLQPRRRGFHLITDDITRQFTQLQQCKIGLLHIFLQHTSAALTINENADSTVRDDFERHFNKMVPEGMPYYKHTCEGPDDIPAHLKSSILGATLLLPVSDGRLNLGIWQGVYLCEHRDHAGSRSMILTLQGLTE